MSGIRQLSIFFFLIPVVCLSQEREPFILNGIPTGAFPAVGIVGEQSVGGFCTGTLITPNHVLTAAHCAEAILDLGSEQSGTFTVGGRTYLTRSVEILPTYNNGNFTDDVAVLVLSESVVGVEPMALSDFPPEVGEIVTVVGFGGQGTAESGSDGSFGEKLVGLTTVDDVSENEISWQFDDAEESNAAPGDSGGPVLIDTGEVYLMVGIVSSGTKANASLGDTTFSMRVDAYEPWITETVLVTQAELDEASAPANPGVPAEEAPDAPTEETPAAPVEEPGPDVPDEQPVPEPEQPPAGPEVEASPPPSSNPECPAAPTAPAEAADTDVTSAPEAETSPDAESPPAATEDPSSEESTGEDESDAVVAEPDGTRGIPSKNRWHHGHRRRGGGFRRPVGGYRDASRNYVQTVKSAPQRKGNVRRR